MKMIPCLLALSLAGCGHAYAAAAEESLTDGAGLPPHADAGADGGPGAASDALPENGSEQRGSREPEPDEPDDSLDAPGKKADGGALAAWDAAAVDAGTGVCGAIYPFETRASDSDPGAPSSAVPLGNGVCGSVTLADPDVYVFDAASGRVTLSSTSLALEMRLTGPDGVAQTRYASGTIAFTSTTSVRWTVEVRATSAGPTNYLVIR